MHVIINTKLFLTFTFYGVHPLVAMMLFFNYTIQIIWFSLLTQSQSSAQLVIPLPFASLYASA